MTAQSFADAFDRVAQPRLNSPATAFMREIVGASGVIEGRARSISGIRVLGRYRLQIRLTRPLGDFTARLTLPFFCPILPSTRVAPAGIDNPAGSGPYYVAERIPNQRIVLERNPHYRGDRPRNVDRVVFTIGLSREACVLAVEEDRIDHCVHFSDLGTAYRGLHEKYALNRPDGQLFVSPSLQTSYLAFNHDRPAFQGPGQIPLKKAINYALDRPELTRAAGYLAGKRTDQMLPRALGRAESIYPLGGPNLAAARRLYARARIKPTTLVLYASNSAPSIRSSEALRFQLRQLGIDLEIKYVDAEVLLAKISTRDEPFDLVRDGWVVDYADGSSFLGTLLDGRNLRPTGNVNHSYFDDPRDEQTDRRGQRAHRRGAAQGLADLDVHLMRTNPPWAPISHPTARVFVSKSFGCVVVHPLYGVDLAAPCKRDR